MNNNNAFYSSIPLTCAPVSFSDKFYVLICLCICFTACVGTRVKYRSKINIKNDYGVVLVIGAVTSALPINDINATNYFLIVARIICH